MQLPFVINLSNQRNRRIETGYCSNGVEKMGGGGKDRRFWSFVLLLLAVLGEYSSVAEGLGVNWGTRASHPLPADIVVRLLKDNGLKKVKLFEADPMALRALGNSGIEVMVGIPNDLLAPLAGSVQAAEAWVQQNVSAYVSKYGADIRYVAVGNEPFLTTYKGMFTQTTFPALQNIQAALIKAGLGKQVKATVPLNADVYETATGLPSGGDFRPEIRTLMVSIIKFLINNGAPLVINIYPFLSLYADPNFPMDFAFFSGAANPVVDGGITYTNVFDANYDTLVSALEKNGFPNAEVIIGEVGWPTDGDKNANLQYASKFNQGLVNKLNKGQGSPKRSRPPETYLFGLIDEDAKSVDPGNFERHWGIFYYDGTIKYPLDLGNGRNLVPAKNVRYLDRQWCVLSPDASDVDSNLPTSVGEACTYADCTSLGLGSSCGGLDARGNVSYAFNMYYQTANQQKGTCQFSNLSVVTRTDPSRDGCRFPIMIDTGRHDKARSAAPSSGAGPVRKATTGLVFWVLMLGRFYWWMRI